MGKGGTQVAAGAVNTSSDGPISQSVCGPPCSHYTSPTASHANPLLLAALRL